MSNDCLFLCLTLAFNSNKLDDVRCAAGALDDSEREPQREKPNSADYYYYWAMKDASGVMPFFH